MSRIFRSFQRQTHLNNEHDDEHKDEGGVEVGDVERGPETSDQSIAAYDDGEEHGGQLGAEVLDEGVEDGGAGDGERHHDDEVGEEGEAAEDEVRAAPEAGLDHLRFSCIILSTAFFQAALQNPPLLSKETCPLISIFSRSHFRRPCPPLTGQLQSNIHSFLVTVKGERENGLLN